MDDKHDSLLCSQYFTDKVLLTGDNGVGKTSIFNRFLTGMFERDVYQHRVAEHKKIWEIDGKQVSMTLFDTGEIEFVGRPGQTPPNLFSCGKAVLMVYSINDSESFDSLPSWLDMVFSRASDAVIALVGNKIDLYSDRTVPPIRVKELASLYGIPSDLIFEVSAKDNTNIQSMFNTIATNIQPFVKQAENKTKIRHTSTDSKKCC